MTNTGAGKDLFTEADVFLPVAFYAGSPLWVAPQVEGTINFMGGILEVSQALEMSLE